MLTVHCHSGVFEENVQDGDSGGCPFAADPRVHDHTEPLVATFITQGCQLKCPLGGYSSRHGIKGCDVTIFADAAFPAFGEATSVPVYYIALLSTGTGYLLATGHPRGLARALRPTFAAYYRLTHLENSMLCILKEYREWNNRKTRIAVAMVISKNL